MMQTIDTGAMRETSLTGALSRPLLDTGEARTLLLNLDAGQSVDPCKMSCLVLYYFIEGQGQMQIDGERLEFHPGLLVSVPANTTRNITARLLSRVLAVQVL